MPLQTCSKCPYQNFFLWFQARSRTSAWCAGRRSASRPTWSRTCASTAATNRSPAASARGGSSGRSTSGGTGTLSTPTNRTRHRTSTRRRKTGKSRRERSGNVSRCIRPIPVLIRTINPGALWSPYLSYSEVFSCFNCDLSHWTLQAWNFEGTSALWSPDISRLSCPRRFLTKRYLLIKTVSYRNSLTIRLLSIKDHDNLAARAIPKWLYGPVRV